MFAYLLQEAETQFLYLSRQTLKLHSGLTALVSQQYDELYHE